MSKYAEVGSEPWWNFVIQHWPKLIKIIKDYHPYYCRPHFHKITAKKAEKQRQQFEDEIAAEGAIDPEKAFKERDAESLYNILQSTWFGVPESTSCWDVDGFSEMVTILEEGIENEIH